MDKRLREGSIVLLHPLDDIPEHRFSVIGGAILGHSSGDIVLSRAA